MPNLFDYMGYKIFFWSNENFEPIHVHISKGTPTANSTKIWLTKSGGCIVANNSSRIPTQELRKILQVIESNYFYIISEWKLYYDIDEIKFYC
ncbi:MAG: DUF4160 domain-containing protein [Clostridia bacterium]|nr:DUF4160 domain-containing protein [Clostridia bacterium]